ncbi:GNAT family N-acetyltransferase [Caballeronia sp. LZ062]|uniref:GNAT family N-acetyltransferase n=1 Tax=unclassified Caballeronia TaxID=2646786 RepID=UPI002864A642|nr:MULTISPECIES: GNAT family N-acetyltransferase [unclassified Caballeronia]MDR5856398.1 GNAT family N-acetyltransferase [Caballeronia sp. LZ050]MDR5873068.1 GNAT family N-acetyltransferase [Caballeronia sp. LZ062]
MIAPALQIEVIKAPEEFNALQHEWEALWRRARGRHHESFAVAWLSWECVAKPLGRALRIIAVRSNGRLVAVWPLVRSRNRLWTILRPLSPESADYTTVLADPDYTSFQLTEAVWRAVREQCPSDIVLLPYLDRDGDLYRLASAHDGVMIANEHPYAVARLSRERDWETFAASLGTLSGKKPGALLRRLERQGKVDIRILGPADADDNARMVDWMLACKRGWAERVDKKGAWLYSPLFRNYLVAILNRPPGPDGQPSARMMVLKLDDRPIAANMIGMGTDSILGAMGGFDRQHSKLAPGAVTTEAWVRWAIENRLDFDLGVGSESFKPYWSKGNVAVAVSLQIAQSPWGRVAFAMQDGMAKLAAIRSGLRRPGANESSGKDKDGSVETRLGETAK